MIETADGRVLTGVVAKETPSSVTIRRAKGETGRDSTLGDQLHSLVERFALLTAS